MHNPKALRDEIETRYKDIHIKNRAQRTQKSMLIQCEVNIICGRGGYYQIGKNIEIINENRLFELAGYKTIEEFTEARYRYKRASAYRFIRIARLYDRLVPTIGRDNMPDSASALDVMDDLDSPEEEGYVQSQ